MIEEVRLPEISENVETGEVLNILVKKGDFVEKEQSLVELETEKAAFEVPSPVKGKIVDINIQEGDEVKVGQVIMKIDTEAEPGEGQPQKPAEEETDEQGIEEAPPAEKTEAPEEKPQVTEKPDRKAGEHEHAGEPEEPEESRKTTPTGEAVPAAPSVRQLARELGVDIHDVTGSAESGRITAEDVKDYARGIILVPIENSRFVKT